MTIKQIEAQQAEILRIIQTAAAASPPPLIATPADAWREAAFELGDLYDRHLKTHRPQPRRINAN